MTNDRQNRALGVVDVAHVAGVSPATVSRVMNGRTDVDDALTHTVLMTSRQLGFVPKVAHQCIAVVASAQSPLEPMGYTNSMIAALTHHLGQRGYTIELVEQEELELTYRAHVRGVIAVVCGSELLPLLDIPNLPVLTVNERMVERGIHSVCTDHKQQGELATAHLLAHGHRRIAFLESTEQGWGSRQRRAGYEAAMKQAGVKIDPALIQYALQRPLYDTLARFVNQGATALVNFSEHSGLETLHILTNILRLAIPSDISVVTMENLPVLQYLTPPHTVVRQPLDELARVAAAEMIALCNRSEDRRRRSVPDGTVDVRLKCELIERESVATLDES
jgi:LacI family transcriptional regulator